MKLINKMTSILLLTSVFFISCDIKKDNNIAFKDNPRIELLTLDNGNEVIVRKDYYGTYSFNNWNTYNLANIEIHRIETADYEIPKSRLLNLNDEVSSLDKKMPNWLKTEEVLEDIADVKEEFTKLIEEQNAPMKNIKQNWDEFEEKFDDLREELSETVDEFQM